MTADLVLTGVRTVFDDDVVAVRDLDLHVESGEFFALLGPSGCGKTTLLRTVAGLETPTVGRIRIDDRDVTTLSPGRRELAMVFQDYALYPHMTVTANVAYPLKVKRVGRAAREREAEDAALQLQLEGLLGRRPDQLSGGQQQRVALARAIVSRPRVLLLDEPLSNLDARLRLEARTYLKRLQAELGITTVYVTHDQSEALALADRMAVMRDGALQQVATPEEVYRRPATRFVAEFIGTTPMNLLTGEVVDGRLTVAGTRTDAPPGARDGEVTVGIRPEDVRVVSEPSRDSIRGRVAVCELLGSSWLLTADRGDHQLRAVIGRRIEPGTEVDLVWDADALLCYDADGSLQASAPAPAP